MSVSEKKLIKEEEQIKEQIRALEERLKATETHLAMLRQEDMVIRRRERGY